MGRRSHSELIEVIRQVPMFAHLSKGAVGDVAKLCFETDYAAGEVIVKQLDDAQHMVVLVAGTARVKRDGHDIATLGPGDTVGEMALLDGLRRSATVTAETPVEALILHRGAFLKLLDANPAITRALLVAQTSRLREMDKKLGATG